jgi:RNA polymerase sigma-70 factor (ECF subfamily)
MCGRLGRTEDIYQDVWTRIYLYRRKYDRAMPFGPFLFAVAVNCCRTVLASSDGHVRLSLYDPEAIEQAPADQDTPLDRLISAEQRRSLQAAIGRLPNMQRCVVLLYLLCDSNYAHIADILGRSAGTVRSQMHHALRSLRSCLERPMDETVGRPKCEVNHD